MTFLLPTGIKGLNCIKYEVKLETCQSSWKKNKKSRAIHLHLKHLLKYLILPFLVSLAQFFIKCHSTTHLVNISCVPSLFHFFSFHYFSFWHRLYNSLLSQFSLTELKHFENNHSGILISFDERLGKYYHFSLHSWS